MKKIIDKIYQEYLIILILILFAMVPVICFHFNYIKMFIEQGEIKAVLSPIFFFLIAFGYLNTVILNKNIHIKESKIRIIKKINKTILFSLVLYIPLVLPLGLINFDKKEYFGRIYLYFINFNISYIYNISIIYIICSVKYTNKLIENKQFKSKNK